MSALADVLAFEDFARMLRVAVKDKSYRATPIGQLVDTWRDPLEDE